MTTAGFLGADTERLRGLGRALLTSADTVTAVRTRADKAVRALDWHGTDQAAFLATWLSSFLPMLERIREALQTAAQDVGAQAAAQESASSATGGGAAGGAVGAAAGGAASGGAAGTGAAAQAGGTPGGATPQAGQAGGTTGQLGDLSAQHESGGRSDTVSTGKGDPVGGISYGKYQIATGTGTAKEFVSWLGRHDSPYAADLQGLTPGGSEFKQAWQQLAQRDPDGFAKAQFDFIKQTHFDPAMRETYARVPGFSLEGRSPVVAETLFSTTVQHRMNTDVIVSRALAGKDPATMSDADVIRAIYDERGRGDGSVYFRSSPARTQHNIAERFEREKEQALRMLGE